MIIQILKLYWKNWPKLLTIQVTKKSSGRRVHTGRQVCSGRRALVQLGVAKASLKPALSSATRVEGPLNNV